MMRWLRYRRRRIWLWFAEYPKTVCGVPTCPENSGVYSAWCHEHTRQIFEHRIEPDLGQELNRRGFTDVTIVFR